MFGNGKTRDRNLFFVSVTKPNQRKKLNARIKKENNQKNGNTNWIHLSHTLQINRHFHKFVSDSSDLSTCFFNSERLRHKTTSRFPFSLIWSSSKWWNFPLKDMQEDNENYMQTHCLDSVAFVFAVVIGSLFVCIFLFLSFVNRKKNNFRLFETEVRFACTLILVIICHEHRKKKMENTKREKKQPTNRM